MEKVAAARSGNSFSSEFKIKTPVDFRKAFREGRKAHSENFTLCARPNSLGFPRLGISIGRKAVRSSAGRNRTKRLLREFFRKNKGAFSSNDVVVVVKNDVSGRKFSEIRREIEKLVGGVG